MEEAEALCDRVGIFVDGVYILPLPTSEDHGGTQLRQYFAGRHRGAAAAANPWRRTAPAVLHGETWAQRRRFGSRIPMAAAISWRHASPALLRGAAQGRGGECLAAVSAWRRGAPAGTRRREEARHGGDCARQFRQCCTD